MPDVAFEHVVSCSSEDPAFPGKNLLLGNRKWRTAKDGDSTASVILQLKRETRISKVDIGNNGSAFVEVLVGKSSAPEKDFEVLLLTSSFMTPAESRGGTDTTRVRMFDQDKLCDAIAKLKWDRVKVVCHQKFNPRAQFGLSFVQLQAPAEESAGPSSSLGRFVLRDEPEDDFVPGSLFARRNQPPSDPPSANKPSTAAAIAGAASSPAALAGHTKAAVIIPKKRDTPVPVAKRKIIQSPASTSKSPEKKKFGKFRRELDSGTEEEEVADDEDKSYKAASDTEFESDGPSSDGVEESPLGHKKAPKRRRTTNKDKKAEPTPKIRRAAQRVPFKQLLQGVTIVLSGFQNPIRGILRDNATDMGAKYKTDWDSGCTHLISAFANTPKVRQVKSMGGGRIVTKEWLEQCFRKRTRFPWRRFALDTAEQEHSESEEEILEQIPGTSNGSSNAVVPPAEVDSDPDIVIADEPDIVIADDDEMEEPVVKQSAAAVSPEYDADTDYESDSASTAKWPKLPDFFDGLVFALHEQLSADVRQKLRRYIISAKGQVEDNLTENCKILVAEQSEDLSELQEFCPDVKSVRPEWVWQCMDSKRLQPL